METGLGPPAGGPGTRLEAGCHIKKLYVFNDKFGNDSDNVSDAIWIFNWWAYNWLFRNKTKEWIFDLDIFQEIGKVLYFYPSDTDEDTQLKQVGLSEAIIQFAT